MPNDQASAARRCCWRRVGWMRCSSKPLARQKAKGPGVAVK